MASLAFDLEGSLLAVAAGHKVCVLLAQHDVQSSWVTDACGFLQMFFWQYEAPAEGAGKPRVVLKTQRTMRAVQFHPVHPCILTAEVWSEHACALPADCQLACPLACHV